MDISVIVPALNEENFIEKCLVSLKNQDFDGKYEIIVADGGSKDRTVQIAKRYADKVVICPRGVSKQRNLGAKKAKGEIVAFIDSDTIAHKNWLKEICETLSNKGTVAMVGTLLPIEKDANVKIYKIANVVQRGLVKANVPLFWGASCAFTKKAFNKVGGFDEKLTTSEDHDISLRIKEHGKTTFNKNMIAFTSNRRFESRDGWKFYVAIGLNYFLFKKTKEYVPVTNYRQPQNSMEMSRNF